MDASLVAPPPGGRTFVSRRRVRLDDMDATGRVRLDALARFMQDAAIDDVDETGWGTPGHLWFVRSIRLHVLAPFLADRALELLTWCSGVSTSAAGRRWAVTGDAGGRAEVDSVWIHLDPTGRPARIVDFGAYAAAAAGRPVSTRLSLPDPPSTADRSAFPLRASDVDLHGHVNNAVHWQAIEESLHDGPVDLARPLRARLDFRRPIEPGDAVALRRWDEAGETLLALESGPEVKAVAALAGT